MDHYRSTYAQGFPVNMESKFRFLIKQLRVFYTTKGTEKSINCTMKSKIELEMTDNKLLGLSVQKFLTLV